MQVLYKNKIKNKLSENGKDFSEKNCNISKVF